MLHSENPTDESHIKDIETDTPDSIKDAFLRAKRAQKEWCKRPYQERAAAISSFRDALAADEDELARLLTQEMGKPLGQALGEIRGTRARIDFFLAHTEQFLRQEQVLPTEDTEDLPAMREVISYDPLGVVANISAWNYPYFVGSNVFIPALLTGNAVLYKPSEFTTLTGLAIVERLHKAGIPKDVCIAVVGGGDVGAALLNQPLDGVFFTGSYATGKKILAAAAQQMMKVQLELGGKDPVYICDDVDVQQTAISAAEGAFYNAGQSCCAIERIYVHKDIYEPFVEAFVEAVKDYKVGDPMEEGTFIGPLARGAQFEVLQQQIDDAQAKGATCLLGGTPLEGKGHFFAPTVFRDVNHDMLLMKDETFGPVIGIQAVENDAEAIEKMCDTEYGLTAGVFTQDMQRAEAILAEMDTGSVYWNCCDRVSPRLPWTGRNHSGMGSTLSHIGITTFLKPKAWHMRRPA